ncbi:hypothetical protein N7456_002525 [Penicillium angulare]|uniref:Isochorismatase-like domain-containing protein n=1 Tax=Penicillium angulare TaxID=116970 RepID=A0A9W9G8G4_9EURO|nr:hypothetical protein N7456_002525 [Penicillium angulare]
MSSQSSPFHIPIDLSHTALLLSDIQTDILARFSQETQASYLAQILSLLDLFRAEIARRQEEPSQTSSYQDTPLIIHHVLPFGYNSNAFISPYNKLSSWVQSLERKGFFTIPAAARDPRTPNYPIPASLLPPTSDRDSDSAGFGKGPNEILLPKFQTSSFGSSDLLGYLRARGVRHVVLCGLTTMGAILGGARQGADLDYHIVIPRQAVMDDEEDVNSFLLERVLPKFVDVVDVDDVKKLF